MYIGQLYVYTWSIDYFISICLPCRSWDNAEVNPMVFRYACHCIAATPVRGLNDSLLDHELRSPLFCISVRNCDIPFSLSTKLNFYDQVCFEEHSITRVPAISHV